MNDIAEGKTSVWPGTMAATEDLAISPATLRRHKAALEEAGYILRKYDHRNRPLENDAIDLRPFLLSTPSLLEKVEERRAKRRAAQQAARQADMRSDISVVSAQVRKNEPLNSPPESSESCSEFFDFELGKWLEPDQPKPTQTLRANDRRTEAEVIEDALKISPMLRKALLTENVPLSPEEAARRLFPALSGLFEGADAASIGHTCRWAIRRYGVRVFDCLAVALEDPKVGHPEKYFGWLATCAEPPNLTINLERVRRKNPPPLELAVHTTRTAQLMMMAIAKQVGVAAANSYFGPDKTVLRQEGEALLIETNSNFVRDRVESRYSAELRVVAESMGLKRANCVLRKDLVLDPPEEGRKVQLMG